MTLEQIERHLERAMDRLDHSLMSGNLSQEQYDNACLDLLREETELLRDMRERELSIGASQHSAWYDLSAELR
jgi:hypothetical protein